MLWRAQEPLEQAIQEQCPERLRPHRDDQKDGSISKADLMNIESGYRAALQDVLGKTLTTP